MILLTDLHFAGSYKNGLKYSHKQTDGRVLKRKKQGVFSEEITNANIEGDRIISLYFQL